LTGELGLGGGLLLDTDFSGVGKMEKILSVRTLFKVLTTDASAQTRTRDLGLPQTSNNHNINKHNIVHISERA